MAKKAAFKIGDTVNFLGYSEEMPDNEKILTEGNTYTVVEVNDAEELVSVEMANPEFNPKKAESDKNPKTLIVDVFLNEVELADGEEEEAPPPKKAASKTAAKGKAKGKAVAEEEEEEEEEEADEEEEEEEEEAPPPKKTAAKGKAAAKEETKAKTPAKKTAAKAPAKADAKTKAPAKSKAKDEEEADEDDLPDLENEDEEVAALVEEAENVLDLAEELINDSAAIDYKLGGVLYHIRKGKLHHKADKRYREAGGFGLYVKERLNVEYRKAMNLIEIYVNFNLAGISGEKVAEIGWTKASKIASLMSQKLKGGAEVDDLGELGEELVKVAENSSVSDLVDTIKEDYAVAGASKGEKVKRITFRFRLIENAGAAVTEVLEAQAKLMGAKDLSDAFEHIVMEWAVEHMDTPPEIKVPAEGKTAGKSAGKAASASTAKGKTAGKTTARRARTEE